MLCRKQTGKPSPDYWYVGEQKAGRVCVRRIDPASGESNHRTRKIWFVSANFSPLSNSVKFAHASEKTVVQPSAAFAGLAVDFLIDLLEIARNIAHRVSIILFYLFFQLSPINHVGRRLARHPSLGRTRRSRDTFSGQPPPKSSPRESENSVPLRLSCAGASRIRRSTLTSQTVDKKLYLYVMVGNSRRIGKNETRLELMV
jgi:hypothetical protein